MRKFSWLPKSGEIIINSKCLRLQREVVGGKEAEKRNKSFPSSSHRRLAFPILNTTHLSRRFDKFMYKHGNKTENNHSKIQFHKEQVNQVLQKSEKKNHNNNNNLPVVDFHVLLGPSSKKYTESFTTYS